MQVPDSILNIGGLIGRIADYTISQAFRPSRELAIAGAICWLAHIMGRRYRSQSNTRPNVYMLALGWSGTGKDAPRDTNFRLAKACGMQQTVIEDFKSGEALQDALLSNGRIISMFDEVDGLFKSIKDSRNAVGANLCSEMLKAWNKSKNFMPRRKLAMSVMGRQNDKTPNVVYHPHFTFFATGVTSEVYKSIDSKMAMNGFFARLMVMDGGRRGAFQTPEYKAVPIDIVEDCKIIAGWREDAKTWVENDPKWDGTGITISEDSDVKARAAEIQNELEAHYDEEEDGAYNAIWNRSFEKIYKLAMIFAVSDNPACPVIRARHLDVAREFVGYSNEMQIAMFTKYAAETDYEDLQKRIIRILSKGITCNRSLLARLHIKNEELKEAVETLQKSGQIIFCKPDGEVLPEYGKAVCYALA